MRLGVLRARIKVLSEKTVDTIREFGLRVFFRKTCRYLAAHFRREDHSKRPEQVYMDVLFVNGCCLPHPARYRVTHQREQLLANNVSSNEVFYENLTLDLVKHYRMFVFFRCPYTDTVGAFIQLAKAHNKTVLFDIDDLVIDRKYTDRIKFVQEMSAEDKAIYDSGVERMQRTLRLCDGAITTTECLARELLQYVPEVHINRNTASDRMAELSRQAVYDRDELPRIPLEELKGFDRRRARRRREEAERRKKQNVIRIGYFSGSITHNDDIEMILPALVEIMRKYRNVELHFAGELTVPEALKPYQDRLKARPFVPWEKLPALIASVDINIAPLTDTVFNAAKSENKWVEAALVKVPTAASRVGAFAQMIQNGETGFLCSDTDEWTDALSTLIEHGDIRRRVAENAFRYVKEHCCTIYTGHSLAAYLRGRMSPNFIMVLPTLQLSGGILVAMRHCAMMKNQGFDVTVFSDSAEQRDLEYGGETFSVLSTQKNTVRARLDKAVATLWSTVDFITKYPNIGQRYYLVQGFETDFIEAGRLKIKANQTYSACVPMKYVTVSRWCRSWLEERYGKTAAYAPNGIALADFPARTRPFGEGKVRILVEGNCSDFFKNVDESFRIIEQLDRNRFEIWYMSYQGRPQPWYRVDRFLHKVPHAEVGKIYAQCDILLKSSILESFSYPPLEMMATGGCVVVAPNGGNIEYLADGENCLMYAPGDLPAAVRAIAAICSDQALRARLAAGGLKTARGRDWGEAEKEILRLYDV